MCIGLECSSLKAMYIKMNRRSEQFCKIVNVAFDMTAPGVVLPKALYCFYVYFTTDMGRNSFELPAPFW